MPLRPSGTRRERKIGLLCRARRSVSSIRISILVSPSRCRVAPAPFSCFAPMLEAELGDGWLRFFRHVDAERVGTPSLAQVYRVELKSGRRAVAKSQRTRNAQRALNDMGVLQWVEKREATR